jgi:dihydrofolate reductase
VAKSKNNVIGVNNSLPWHYSTDLKRFKTLTEGHVLICGRKTWESINKPLPKRKIFVISKSNINTSFNDVYIFNNIDEAIYEAYQIDNNPFVIGGSVIYSLTLPLVSTIEVTEIDKDIDGDIYFPEVNYNEFDLIKEEKCSKYQELTFKTYKRK